MEQELQNVIQVFRVVPSSLKNYYLKYNELTKIGQPANENTNCLKKMAAMLKTDTTRTSFVWQQRLLVLVRKQFFYYLRNWFFLLNEVLIPLLIVIGGCSSLNTQITNGYLKTEVPNQEELVLNAKGIPVFIPSEYSNETNVNSLMEKVIHLLHTVDKYQMKVAGIDESVAKQNKSLGIAFSVFHEERSHNKTITAYFNGNAKMAPAVAINIINNARIKNSEAIIASVQPYGSGPLPGLVPLNEENPRVHTLLIFFFIFSNTAFSLIFSGFLVQIVHENRCYFKQQLLLTGLSSSLYWASILIGDLLFYIIICSILIIPIVVSKWVMIVGYEFLLLWILQFWAFMAVIGCISYMFTSLLKAYLFMLIYLTCLPYVFALVWATYTNELNTIDTFLMGCLYPPIIVAFYFGYGFKLTLKLTAVFLGFIGVVYVVQLYIIEKLSGTFEYISEIILTMFKKFDEKEEGYGIRNEQQRVNVSSPYFLAIRIENLTKFSKHSAVLKDLCFGVDKNECFGLLGSSNAGKSVLCDVLTGKTFLNGGTATINGSPVEKKKPFGYSPQKDAFLEFLTVNETLKLMIILRGYTDVEKRLKILLEMISLDEVSNQPVVSLSTNQRQLLKIGIAILTQTRVILLDEPTEKTDRKTRDQIWNILEAIHEQKYSILLMSSSMEECTRFCDRIGVLRNGKLIVVGTPQSIIDKTAEGYELAFEVKNKNVKINFDSEVRKHFPKAVLVTDDAAAHMVWHIPRSPENSWSKIYGIAEQLSNTYFSSCDYLINEIYMEECV